MQLISPVTVIINVSFAASVFFSVFVSLIHSSSSSNFPLVAIFFIFISLFCFTTSTSSSSSSSSFSFVADMYKSSRALFRANYLFSHKFICTEIFCTIIYYCKRCKIKSAPNTNMNGKMRKTGL